MRRYFMTSIVLLPLLLTFSHAAQSVSVDSPSRSWVFSSDEKVQARTSGSALRT